MKINWVGRISSPAILEHTNTVDIGIRDGCDGIIVEDPLQHTPEGIDVINTCSAVKLLLLREDLQDEFYKKYEIIKKTPYVFLYSYFNGEKFGDIIEISYDTHFMSGGVGPRLGLIHLAAISCDSNVYMAFPQLEALRNALREIKYRGEITFGCTKDFTICSLAFGHNLPAFALYTELSQLSAQQNFEFCFGVQEVCPTHKESIAISTLLSNPPFPTQLKINTCIHAPGGAEKHLYRKFHTPEQEIAYAACWGTTAFEARERIYRVINGCSQCNPQLQYRSDVGRKATFLYNEDLWKQLSQKPT